jgi:protein-tyrosine-phosphatase
MASALFQRLVDELEPEFHWRVESAGTWAVDGMPASSGSVEVMNARGLDISDHKSRNITGEIVDSFDLILTMEEGHKEALRTEFPEYADRIFVLSEMAGHSHDIRDPIGSPLSEYEATAQELTILLEKGYEKIKSFVS